MTGNLKTRGFPLLLADLDKATRSGVLTLSRGDPKRQICVIRGRIRLAASNLRGERFIEFLRREAGLPAEVMQKLDTESAGGSGAGALLVEWNAATAEQVKELARRHAMEILLACREWTDGSFKFEQGVPDIAGAAHVDIGPLEVVLEGARRNPDAKLLARLAANPDGRLRPATTRDLPAELRLNGAERAVLARVGTGIDIGAVLALAEPGSDLTREQILAAACALVQAQLLVREKAILVAREESREGDVIDPMADFVAGDAERYLELIGRMEGQDHYQILGVPVTAPEKEIRRSYYSLAKQLHPDRFTSPEMQEIRPRMEALFARITEAYNTLTDTFARREYDVGRGGVGTVAQTPVAEAAMTPTELARANYLRGRQLFEENQFQRAMTFLKNAVELDASRPEHLFMYGRALSRNPSQREQAIDFMTRASGLDPTKAEFQLELGKLYVKLERPEEAERAFRTVLRWSPRNEEAKAALEELTAPARGGMLKGLFGRKK